MRKISWLALFFGSPLFLLISCQPTREITEEYLIEKKEQQQKAIRSWNQSFATVDVSIDLQPYLKQLNDIVPTEFHQANWTCEGVSFDLNAKRKPLTFIGHNQEITISTKVDYDLKINYCPKCSYLINEKGTCLTPRIKGSCGIDEAKRRAEIGFTTTVNLQPNYRLSSSTSLSKLDLIDPCEITIASIDITDRLRKELSSQLTLVSTDIDKKIQQLNSEKEANELWRMLSFPITIEPYGRLFLQPQTIALGTHSFDKTKLNFPVELQVKPVFSTIETIKKINELPELSSRTTNKGYNLTIPFELGYDSVSSFLSSALKNKKFNVKHKIILLDSIRAFPNSTTQIGINAYFSGDLKGTLNVVGTPCLKDSTQQFLLPDLQHQLTFDKKLYTIVGKLFRKKIAETLTSSLTFELTPLLLDLKKEIEKALNTNLSADVIVTGDVQTIELLHIEAKELFLYAFLQIRGQLKLSH